jgi:hypothetical protein
MRHPIAPRKINGRSASSFLHKGLEGGGKRTFPTKDAIQIPKSNRKKQRRKISLPALRSFEQT